MATGRRSGKIVWPPLPQPLPAVEAVDLGTDGQESNGFFRTGKPPVFANFAYRGSPPGIFILIRNGPAQQAEVFLLQAHGSITTFKESGAID
jgi:hypothetical protein